MPSYSLDIRSLRSFVTVAETGSITETARRQGRTQPAITLQIKRLEEMTGMALFAPESRRPQLTDAGELVRGYAVSMLRLHDELLSRLSTPDIEGHVVLGTPDLYSAYLLPAILARFRKTFPRIQVELRCSLSTPLVGMVQRGEVDIALVTRMRGFTGGRVVRQEQLIWLMGEGQDTHLENPVPLALLPPGNVYRDHAIEALERTGRKWRIACISESLGGLQAAVFSGMAITVLGQSAQVPGMKQIGMQDYFPPLPKVELLLYQAPGASSPAAAALHNYLETYLGQPHTMPGLERRTAPDTGSAAAQQAEGVTAP
ncbi:LysR substrate-binding domain-containing protein [Marinibaculum pumilum]|uniref:LysR substrate-binding domain-containing protein n=1 Tax=Marinibaculum pumilum TaxID=1766165 RepID=A0ABV7L3T6_9PROT